MYCISGSHQGELYNERSLREVAGLDRFGTAGRRRVSGVQRGKSRHRRQHPPGTDTKIQRTTEGLRRQAERLPATGPLRTRS